MAGSKGGFHIGTVGGNASFRAGSDMVAGDKITQTTTTTVENGFKQDDDKQKFLQQIEELRAALRELQAKTAEVPGLSQDAKDEIAAEVLQQVNTLKKARDEAAGLPVAEQPPPEKLQVIEQGLESTSTLLDKVTALCDKAEGFGEKIEPYVSKALPILLSSRHLFGLP
jgi:wyosine [tRNA(Phe)-imidazoG37] synthetase (radical SAM superfamily)